MAPKNKRLVVGTLLTATSMAGCVPQSVTPNPDRYAIVEKCTAQARHAYPSQGEQHVGNDRTYVYEDCMHKNGQAP
jgi:hypothetical protein